MSHDAGAAAPERERADARRNRERILCAAARLIDERGMCFSMDDVAHEAGVGKGTLYRRFGDRAALLRALISEPEQAFQDALIRGEAPLGPGAPPEVRLHAFGEGLLTFLNERAIYLQAGELMGGSKRYGHPVYAFYRTHVSLLLKQACGGDAAPTTSTWSTPCSARCQRRAVPLPARPARDVGRRDHRRLARPLRRRPRRRAGFRLALALRRAAAERQRRPRHRGRAAGAGRDREAQAVVGVGGDVDRHRAPQVRGTARANLVALPR